MNEEGREFDDQSGERVQAGELRDMRGEVPQPLMPLKSWHEMDPVAYPIRGQGDGDG